MLFLLRNEHVDKLLLQGCCYGTFLSLSGEDCAFSEIVFIFVWTECKRPSMWSSWAGSRSDRRWPSDVTAPNTLPSRVHDHKRLCNPEYKTSHNFNTYFVYIRILLNYAETKVRVSGVDLWGLWWFWHIAGTWVRVRPRFGWMEGMPWVTVGWRRELLDGVWKTLRSGAPCEKSNVFYGHQRLRGESTTTVYGVSYNIQCFCNATDATSSCGQLQPVTDNGIRGRRSNWLAVTNPPPPPHIAVQYPWAYLAQYKRISINVVAANGNWSSDHKVWCFAWTTTQDYKSLNIVVTIFAGTCTFFVERIILANSRDVCGGHIMVISV